MALSYIDTSFWLPPAPPSAAVVRELLQRIFEEYRWFQPMRDGLVFTDERLEPGHIDYDAVVSFYSQHRGVTVLADTDRDFIMLAPTLPDAPPSWAGSPGAPPSPRPRAPTGERLTCTKSRN
ncbi:hypothetical protein [Myxococcus sp. RHSTA-1-4]|uniref:hypothetical protein n=1 Tax=Myxococcus sp. RHSTA-1-4 TaxID=2874601 RepID=UPI001CBF6C79|nr:hypothetical protein [Myxococcus sp. RHSTA-1-4]MBZ4415420.1 hypothetical protein [Myxococcus sp. RHSTA-1-4]